jgi:hypothetical protein
MILLHSLVTLGSIVTDFASLGGLLIPLGAFAMVAVISITTHLFKNAERQRWHETARIALEKGQQIPSMPNIADDVVAPDKTGVAGRHKQVMGLVTAGLINVAVGIGLFFGLAHMPGAQEARYFALIPGLIGAALLIAGLINASLYRRLSDSGDRTPQS